MAYSDSCSYNVSEVFLKGKKKKEKKNIKTAKSSDIVIESYMKYKTLLLIHYSLVHGPNFVAESGSGGEGERFTNFNPA